MKPKISNYCFFLLGGLIVSTALSGFPAQAAETDGPEIIQSRCMVCHRDTGDAEHPWSRISFQRKTPEGWAMTLRRMQAFRGVYLAPGEEQTLIKYLADNQGLAPAETAEFRYILERQPNVMEEPDPLLGEMCARCHSAARFSVQRRPQSEWEKLVHFHMGQFPTIELQALARDRPWFRIAIEQVVPALTERFPLDNPSWRDWQQAARPELGGSWRVVGYLPDQGDYAATLTAEPAGDDRYTLSLNGSFSDGEPLQGSGQAIVYTGYEWRAALTVNSESMRQVLAASEDGSSLSGRLFRTDHDERGGPMQAVKTEGNARILAVWPSYLKAGASARLTIIGTGLDGEVTLGDGVTVDQVVSQDTDTVVLQVTATANAAPGARTISVGPARAENALAVYDRLARVEVIPGASIARIGGNDGSIPKVESSHRAVGYAAGADGEPGTEDDIRLGFMPASWSVEPFNEIAEEDHDVHYAGVMDAMTGVFTPAGAGPNPARKMSTNNVGNLAVVATVTDGDAEISGQGHLLVTVQTYFDMPIR